ncbi:MAG TPA: hypothetical protein VHN77_10340 [Phycisphaerales bacterium]|nr:hypothetical protein [Phycisphaerales bacterium]
MPAALSIPHANPQPPCFQAESVAPSPLHLLTSSPAHFLPPDTVSRLFSAALSVLEEVAKTSPNPIERRRAATTILRYLFVPPPRAPRAPTPSNASPSTSNPAPRGERATTGQRAVTPTRAAAHTAPPPDPPQLLSAPPLRRTSATPSPAASLLTALATSHDVARQLSWAPTRSAWDFTPYPSLDPSTHVPGLIWHTSLPNAVPTARPPPCEISDAILRAFPLRLQRELRNDAA